MTVLLASSSLSRQACRAVGMSLPLVGRPHPTRSLVCLNWRSFYALGRTEGTIRQSSLPTLTFHRHLSTDSDQSPPISQSSELVSTTPTSSELFESSSQEMWAADAARTLEEGETLASLGLGGYTPVGCMQYLLDLIHSTTGMPWWATIMVSTICIKSVFIPMTIYARENARRMNRINPEVQKIKERQKFYVLARNMERAQEEKQKLTTLFKQHGIRPVLAVVPILVQAIILISSFMAIRGMAYAPVSSMMFGGTLWFIDLTLPDPLYLLPVISSAAMFATIQVGSAFDWVLCNSFLSGIQRRYL